MVLHRSAKADPSGYPGSIPGVSVQRIHIWNRSSMSEQFARIFLNEVIRKILE